MRLNIPALRRRAAESGIPHVLHDLVRPVAKMRVAADAPGPENRSFAETLRALPPHERQERLAQLVRGRVAEVVGQESGDAIAMDRPFADLGFDSLMAVELRGALETATRLRLPATLIFDRPSPAALCDYLAAELLPDDVSGPDVVFAEIDRLEAVLTQIGPQHAHGAQIRSRLRALLGSWELSPRGDDAAEEALAAADFEEVFSIIDDELGSS